MKSVVENLVTEHRGISRQKSKEVRLAMSGSNYLPTVVSNTNENQTESP